MLWEEQKSVVESRHYVTCCLHCISCRFHKTKRIFRTARDLNIFNLKTFFIYKKVFSISLFIKTILSLSHDKSGAILHIKTSIVIFTKRLNLDNPEKQSGLNCIRSLTVLFVR